MTKIIHKKPPNSEDILLGKMNSTDIKYSVRVDGEELCKVTLQAEQYKTQYARNETRRKIALTYNIPMHYIKLCPFADKKYMWDKNLNKNVIIKEKTNDNILR